MAEQFPAVCLYCFRKFWRVGDLPQKDSLAWWTHEHLQAKMLLKLPDLNQKRQAAEHRRGNEVPRALTVPRLDVRRPPSLGTVLHPASNQASQVGSRSKEPPEPDVVQTKRTFALRLLSGRVAGDVDSESSTKHA
jgi:hypothetical protein